MRGEERRVERRGEDLVRAEAADVSKDSLLLDE